MKREEVLDAAANAVIKRRSDVYGPPEQNFDRIANRWNAHLQNRHGQIDYFPLLDAVDVAIMCIDLKLARLEETADHIDSWIDVAGYAACGAEVSHAGEPKVDTTVGGIDQSGNQWWKNKAFVPAENIVGAMQQVFNTLKLGPGESMPEVTTAVDHASPGTPDFVNGQYVFDHKVKPAFPQGSFGVNAAPRQITVGDTVCRADQADQTDPQTALVVWRDAAVADLVCNCCGDHILGYPIKDLVVRD